jgi:PPOX class probable F420-dependent enzyme
MPGYGLPEGDTGPPLLPWSWAEQRLTAARRYWVVTVGEDGRPHAMPVWGVWHGQALWFSTGADSRKARNLRADPRCVVTPDDAAEAVVVEGRAAAAAGEVDAAMREAYREKYATNVPGAHPVFRVAPAVVFAVIEQPEQEFLRATRWTFDDG